MRPAQAQKLEPFGTTIFSEMTRLAQERGAINLSQGFPDFDGPKELIRAASRALDGGENQYTRSMGHPELVRAVADRRRADYGLEYDPQIEVGVYSGATEGLAAAMLGMLNPGDEVVFFEPYYDSYPACAALAGAKPRFVTLDAPDFRIRSSALERAITPRTRLIVLNSPHNPTGRVFDTEELEIVAELCLEHGLRVLTDEVYEYLVYDGATHVPLATLPGMKERTWSVSSLGKSYSVTGWKVGWATGPKDMIAAAQAAHQFLTFATATPLQKAAAFALDELRDDYLTEFSRDYSERRDFLVDALSRAGLSPFVPEGTYFVLADFSAVFEGTDVEFVRHLIDNVGIAAIPPSAFYTANPAAGSKLARFAFCKTMDTLREAAGRLETMGS